ncbi:MAG TPA: CDP-glucose 4,6-dehydratase [Solirubrobacteraceae bacterium]|nr:CDP-glucose 4,6-dehydratase [Solirubrobacteraceae bacterium]
MSPLASVEPSFWHGRRVLVTGHTGFKGAWLSLWLQSLGAEVTGLAPGPPTEPSLYGLARVGEGMAGELPLDVRDRPAVAEAVRAHRPEVLFHLAAQPMVRLSLREPLMTFEVNVMGTANVLDAVRLHPSSVAAAVVVTSDKCYANPPGEPRRLTEDDPLGGKDPYSASKAAAEIVTGAYRESFFAEPFPAGGPRIASARAGNVIGGGDFGEDRLIPDVLRAHAAGRPVAIRNPGAIRPWQHVLNPLSGYLLLAQALCSASPHAAPSAHGARSEALEQSGAPGEAGLAFGAAAARAWNFGPPAEDCRTVIDVVRPLCELLDGDTGWALDAGENPPEVARLELDSSAAQARLGWRARWDLDEALRRVAEWHRRQRAGIDARETSFQQIAAFR